MVITLNKATVKVWFTAQGTSRNLYGVTEIERNHPDPMMRVKSNGYDVLLNFDNIGMMEVTEELPLEVTG